MKWVLNIFLIGLFLFVACENNDITPKQTTGDTTIQPSPQDSAFTPRDPDSLTVNPDSVIVNPDSLIENPDTVILTPDTIAHADSAYYRFGKHNKTPFRFLLPVNYDSNKQYPLLVFLHGIGESGADNNKQLRWGAPLFLEDSIRHRYPAIIVFPQCPTTHYWFDDFEQQELNSLVRYLSTTYNIDKKRIYIGGLSMGAYGTYALVAKDPDSFAAAIAISGDGNANVAAKMKKPKWRIFAGKRDETVPYTDSEKMAKALEKAGASVKYTLYPDADHAESWIKAFAEPDFSSWIFSQSKD